MGGAAIPANAPVCLELMTILKDQPQKGGGKGQPCVKVTNRGGGGGGGG